MCNSCIKVKYIFYSLKLPIWSTVSIHAFVRDDESRILQKFTTDAYIITEKKRKKNMLPKNGIKYVV